MSRSPHLRTALLLVLGALATFGGGFARAASGGPDDYGYTWEDSLGPTVTFAWEDISVTGTDITMAADDQNTGLQPLSFTFTYRGVDYTRLAACTNGWASVVDGGATAYENVALPDPVAPGAMIAVFWDDFKLNDAGKMYRQDFADHVVVTWADVPYFADLSLLATFQVILFADGRIKCQMLSTTGPLDSATIGIQSVDATDGLTARFNEAIPAPPYAVEFRPPAPIVSQLDCAGAVPLGCGDDIVADLATGAANQAQYRCTRADLSGREHVYLVDLTTPTTVRYVFEPISGDPRLLMLPACNPNACSIPPAGPLSLTGYTGQFWFVVDCPPGGEGAYRLRADCLPLDTTLDCSAPLVAECGTVAAGDLAAGSALQDSYWCSLDDYSGSEEVWLIDFPIRVPSVTLTLTALSGNPDMVVLYPCDANSCLAPPSDSATILDAVGPYYIVVDCAPGAEGAYEIAIDGGAPPTRVVGNALRATGHAIDTVDFDWSLAGAARPGEHFAVLRSDDVAAGPFSVIAQTRSLAWTDPDAPARFTPSHVWYYVVLFEDACGNLSAD